MIDPRVAYARSQNVHNFRSCCRRSVRPIDFPSHPSYIAPDLLTDPITTAHGAPVRSILLTALYLVLSAVSLAAVPAVRHDPAAGTVTLVTADGLTLRLSTRAGCAIDRVLVRGENVLGPAGSVTTGMGVNGTTVSSAAAPAPVVRCTGTTATITGITPMSGITERWTFTVDAHTIRWRIEQTRTAAVTCAWNALPSWEFSSPATWKAAFLGTGGVAWFHLIDSANGTLGAHTGKATFWNEATKTALRIEAAGTNGTQVASSFTRLPQGGIRFRLSTADRPLVLRYDEGMHRRRYLTTHDDVWQDIRLTPSTTTVDLAITAPDPATLFPDESMPPFNAASIRALGRTVARLGVIDAKAFGSNSWRTPYGPLCLHEGHIAQMASLIQDEDYVNGYKATLDFYRDRAVTPAGRVVSRWAYTCEDAMPGTCDSLGFYEAQWGYLMDSNPDLVTNVAELFDLCADSTWLAGQQAVCERALDFMLARDRDHDGLVEMMTDDHTAQRGSDWIDIIWASHENAFVNAKMYYALTLWADCEAYLGDVAHAVRYRNAAAQLKASFNRSTREGGLWDEGNRWYVHWREPDGSVHGNNLVTYVNFMAIAYGICDDPVRTRIILGRIETEMQNERLFFWPICLYSYEEGEGLHWQWPFPVYENGDIFLTLGEVGSRAYAGVDPTIPLRIIGNLLERYRQDGLAFQRYLRKDQKGAGDDILAGNAMAVVGLYRNIYGIRPKHDRLIVAPVGAPEIRGTRLSYELRGATYRIGIDSGRTSVSVNGFSIAAASGFAVGTGASGLTWFRTPDGAPSLSIVTSGAAKRAAVGVEITAWPAAGEGIRAWTQTAGSITRATVRGLAPGVRYTVTVGRGRAAMFTADTDGAIAFPILAKGSTPVRVSIAQAPAH